MIESKTPSLLQIIFSEAIIIKTSIKRKTLPDY